MHYQRHHIPASTPVALTTEQRFLLKAAVNKATGCWEWTARLSRDGYGKFQVPRDGGGQRTTRAHRYAYEQWVGPIPTGLLVCHRCDNPICVNPEHLFIGTGSDNKQDEISKGRNNPPRGTRNPRAVLDEATVRRIRQMYVPRRMSYRKIGKLLSVNEGTVKNVIQGTNWKHVA